jgi:hypothetical protein
MDDVSIPLLATSRHQLEGGVIAVAVAQGYCPNLPRPAAADCAGRTRSLGGHGDAAPGQRCSSSFAKLRLRR